MMYFHFTSGPEMLEDKLWQLHYIPRVLLNRALFFGSWLCSQFDVLKKVSRWVQLMTASVLCKKVSTLWVLFQAPVTLGVESTWFFPWMWFYGHWFLLGIFMFEEPLSFLKAGRQFPIRCGEALYDECLYNNSADRLRTPSTTRFVKWSFMWSSLVTSWV